jgi:hypothetical protein
VQGCGLRDDSDALVLDPDETRDEPAAVGSNQVVAGDRVFASGPVVADLGADAVVILLQRVSSWLNRIRFGESSSARALISGSSRI